MALWQVKSYWINWMQNRHYGDATIYYVEAETKQELEKVFEDTSADPSKSLPPRGFLITEIPVISVSEALENAKRRNLL